MNKTLIMLLLTTVFLTACSQQPQVTVDEKTFNVKIVDTPETRAKGLMFVEQMPENEGMLFVFDYEAQHPFWMKNTLIPLDMIWISKDNKIVYLAKNVLPCESDPCQIYAPPPETKALYVLEINGGLSDKQRFEEGTQIQITR